MPTWKIGTGKRDSVSISHSVLSVSFKGSLHHIYFPPMSRCGSYLHRYNLDLTGLKIDLSQFSAARGCEDEPGPGAYTVASSIGKQVHSKTKSSSRVVMPKSDRDQVTPHSPSHFPPLPPCPALLVENLHF